MTIKNEYGEDIHIKIKDDKVWVHHTDVHDDYVELSYLYITTILTKQEIIDIYNTVKKLMHGENVKFLI
jgi:hypothetical protein